MDPDARELFRGALQLSPEDRVDLAARLIGSLDERVDEDVEAAWADEMLEAIEEGCERVPGAGVLGPDEVGSLHEALVRGWKQAGEGRVRPAVVILEAIRGDAADDRRAHLPPEEKVRFLRAVDRAGREELTDAEAVLEEEGRGRRWRARIGSDPDVCHGKTCFRGTRVMVSIVLDFLAEGHAAEEILEQYPSLEEADIRAALAYAADLAHDNYTPGPRRARDDGWVTVMADEYTPPHPGEVLRREFLERLDLTPEELARHLDLPVRRVEEIVREEREVTPEMARLLAGALGTTPELWLDLQSRWDLRRSPPDRSVSRIRG